MPGQWVRASDVVWEELDGEAVLVSSSTQRTWVLNSTASFVWKHCDGSTSLHDIARGLAAAGCAEMHRVRRDVTAFCQELASVGLLSPAHRLAHAAAAPAAVCFARSYLPPGIRVTTTLGAGRGRPSPRGISSPG